MVQKGRVVTASTQEYLQLEKRVERLQVFLDRFPERLSNEAASTTAHRATCSYIKKKPGLSYERSKARHELLVKHSDPEDDRQYTVPEHRDNKHFYGHAISQARLTMGAC